MAATIKEIAQRAKVSQATVSLVLNKKPGVSDSTRERILKIAEQLDYRITRIDSRNSQRNGTIRFLKIATHGHTVNRDHEFFIADYIEGLTRGANLHGFRLEVNSFDRVPVQEIAGTFIGSDLQGVVVLGTELTPDDISTLGKSGVPVVFLDTFHEYLDFDFVDMNNGDSVYKILAYLAANGHREVGFVRSGVKTHNFELRDEGFRRASAALGMKIKESHVYDVDSTFDGAHEDMLRHLSRRKNGIPTALFCTNDIIAYGCIKALKENDYRIPEDVSVVGFDDLPLSSVMDPPLTTMQVSKRQIGQLAVGRLAERMRASTDLQTVKIQVSGKLIVRSSVRNTGSEN